MPWLFRCVSPTLKSLLDSPTPNVSNIVGVDRQYYYRFEEKYPVLLIVWIEVKFVSGKVALTILRITAVTPHHRYVLQSPGGKAPANAAVDLVSR